MARHSHKMYSLSDEHDTNNSASDPHVLFSLFVALYFT